MNYSFTFMFAVLLLQKLLTCTVWLFQLCEIFIDIFIYWYIQDDH